MVRMSLRLILGRPGGSSVPSVYDLKFLLALAKGKYGGQILKVDYSKIITFEPGKRSGQPCIRGLRMTVYDILEYLASGMSHQEILKDFPYLKEEDLRACLAFAADHGRKVHYAVAA